MSCPHLKEVVMLFCDGYARKKLLPLDRIATANPCLGDFHDCPIFKEVITRLNVESNRVVGLPDVQEKYRSQFWEPRIGTPEQFGAQIRSDVAKWSKVIKDAGIRGD